MHLFEAKISLSHRISQQRFSVDRYVWGLQIDKFRGSRGQRTCNAASHGDAEKSTRNTHLNRRGLCETMINLLGLSLHYWFKSVKYSTVWLNHIVHVHVSGMTTAMGDNIAKGDFIIKVSYGYGPEMLGMHESFNFEIV